MNHTHVCLVSEQLIPSILPALKEQPRRMILLCTPQMEHKGRLLERFLRERGLQTTSRSILPYDFEDSLRVCAVVIAECDDQGEQVTLNITGGTKIAALAAYQQFYFSSRRIIYMDTANARILELGDQPASKPLRENLLKVREYLACYDKHCKQMAADDALAAVRKRKQTTTQLCRFFIKELSTLRQLNGHISELKRQQKVPPYTLSLASLLEKTPRLGSILEQGGIITPLGACDYRINNDSNLFYLGGGWLEEYVYNTIADLAIPGLDCRLNVGLQWRRSAEKHSTSNELDVVFTHSNRLHVLSCKTSSLDKGGADTPKGKEALYELDSMVDNVGGLFARSMLVSAHTPSPISLQRARELGIEVVAGHEILTLPQHLQNRWNITA